MHNWHFSLRFKAAVCLLFHLDKQSQPSPSALSSCPDARGRPIKYVASRGLTDCSAAKSRRKKKKKYCPATKLQNKQRTLTATMSRKREGGWGEREGESLANTYPPLNEAGFPFHALLADFWWPPLPGVSCAALHCQMPLQTAKQ